MLDGDRCGLHLDAIVYALRFVLIAPDNVLSIYVLAVAIWPQECMKRRRDRFGGPLSWSQISLSLDPDSIRYQQACPSPEYAHAWKGGHRSINIEMRFAPKRSLLGHSRIDMPLTKRKTRITAKRVADILGCSPKTLYNRGAGAEQLTRIRNGQRQIRFILEELELARAQEERGHARCREHVPLAGISVTV
jgi:hypothetical protein